MIIEKRLMNLKEICEYLNLSSGAVYNLVYEKAIPHFKIGGRLRFGVLEIERWLQNQRTEANYK